MRLSFRRTAMRVTAAVVAVAAAGTATVALANQDERSDDRATEPLCGVSLEWRKGDDGWQAALDRADDNYNGVESVRLFYGGLPEPWPGKVHTGDRPVTVSFKAKPRDVLNNTDGTLDKLREWFAAAPTDKDVYWTYYHEPEDNIADGQFAADDYRAAWQKLADTAAEVGNSHLKATLILMSWSLDPRSGRDWHDYYPGSDTVEVLGWDVYSGIKGNATEYKPIDKMFDPVVEVAEAEGLPFAIAETGSGLIDGDDGTERAAWLRDMADYLTKHGALFVQYFDLDWRSHGSIDFRLTDEPSRKAWAEFCS